MESRAKFGWKVAGVGLALVVALGSSVVAQAGDGPSYVRAKSGGARVRNFQDSQGLVVRELSAGELMRVYGGSVDFLEVEALGGLEVWVFGKYLEPVRDGVVKVTASGVNMRPRSGSDVGNMPIRTKLQRGDELVVIERADPTGPLAEDWVKVWSPQRARGWVHRNETQPVTDTAAASSEWSRPVHQQLVVATPPRTTPAAQGAAQPKADAGARTARQSTPVEATTSKEAAAALAAADALFDQAVAMRATDYTPVVAAYTRVVELAPAGSYAAELAERRLDETRARSEIASLQGEIASEKVRRELELDRLRREQEQQTLKNTVLWGRFHSRGWLEKDLTGGETRYLVRWAGKPSSELICTSGRYDLAVFEGFEVGVMGTTVREGADDPQVAQGAVSQLDIYRLEVISGSRAR